MRMFLSIVATFLLCASAQLDLEVDDYISLLQIRSSSQQDAVAKLGEEKGNNPQARAHPDGASQIEFVDRGAGGFEAAGKLASVRFYVGREGNKNLRFRIYRPNGGGFRFIAQTEAIAVPTNGVIQEYTFEQQIPFLAGDYIGWSHTGNGNIPYDNAGDTVSWNFGITGAGCGNVPFGSGGPRVYSYMITTAPASASDYADAEMCGADVPEGLEDEAGAEADPHLSGPGVHNDLCCEGGHCGPCAQSLYGRVGKMGMMGMGKMGMMGMGKMGMMGMGKMGMMGMMGMGGMGGDAGDEAAAVGDPHITTNTGAHFDLAK